MPLWDFKCPHGHRQEELFFAGEAVPDQMPCKCGSVADRVRAYRFRILGPVFEHLEQYEAALFTPAQRAQGARIRSTKDIERVERAQGIHREDETYYRVTKEELLHENWQIKSVQQAHGVEAALDFVDDLRVKEATGWDDKQLSVYKEYEHAANQLGPPPDAEFIAGGLTEPTGVG